MNYEESQKILDEIKKANKILLNCHRSPDPDSVGGALAMRRVLFDMGKEVEIICPDNISNESKFLQSSGVVRKVDYDNFDFPTYDLFIILDSAEWSQVLGFGKEKKPAINKINIDHHFTNENFGMINLVDEERSSTSEILFRVFGDWGISITKEIAEDLLTGIIYDTSCLEHSSADVGTAKVFVKLMELGADKNKIISNIFRNLDFDMVRAMTEITKNMQIDKEYGFVWSAVPYETISLYPGARGIKSMAAGLYAASVRDANFGMIMIEEKKNYLNVSFRAKMGFDISKIADELGGGGHKQAGATVLRDISFKEAVEKVLEAARKYVNKS
ncbi:MAG: DHH family protein [Candidatus Woesebacteria bacterium GW2011_GWB1_41_10]|uniref:DHH family protein n=1 Tax=Candidatus Woesebacteria bacterium GW2011_GWB1_41_10 TaxID=1618577 RepID=A0A0G0UAF7_9BACT|nr:MAG: DHH family protein [Candidatus Woesebacteria bacterium GW2011_GWB1_41_10]